MQGSVSSRYAPSQWEMSLQCNNISHWLGAYLDWSLEMEVCGWCNICWWCVWHKLFSISDYCMYFFFSHNSITTVPESIGNLTSLKVCFASWISFWLEGLRFLVVCTISKGNGITDHHRVSSGWSRISMALHKTAGSNSSALKMELLLFCTEPSIWHSSDSGLPSPWLQTSVCRQHI